MFAAAGAEFLICPDNTIHQAFEPMAPRSPLPWLHIADVVAAEAAAARGFQRVGLTGTRWLVDSAVYPDRLAVRGIACVRPGEDERSEINRIIMEELVPGVVKEVDSVALPVHPRRLARAGLRRRDPRLHGNPC